MPPDAVPRQHEWFGRVAEFDTTGPDPAGVNVVLLEAPPQIRPQTLEKFAGHDLGLISGEQGRAAGLRWLGLLLTRDRRKVR